MAGFLLRQDRRAEVPVDEHNHALAALRYLIARLDKNSLATRASKSDAPTPPTKTLEELAEEERNRKYWEMAESDDPRIWWALG